MKSWEQRIGDVLSFVRLDSIKNKIVALAIAATLVPALSTTFVSYTQNRRALTESLEEELRSTGSQTARELDLWVKERFYDVRVFEGSFEVSENVERIARGGAEGASALERLTDYLTGVEGRFVDYSELIVTDVRSRPVATSGDTLRAITFPDDWPALLRQGESLLGEPYVQPSGDVVAEMSVPIASPNGVFLGALTATITFDRVREILEGFAPGDAGRVDLVTDDGRVIVTSEPASADPLDPAMAPDALTRLTASGDQTAEYTDRDGRLAVGTLTDVPTVDWAVITEIPNAEAYAQIAELRNTTVILVLSLLVVVGAAAYLLGQVIVRPLARLTQGAGAVAGGDLSVDLPVTGRGEVGYLTEVFNEMVGRLRRSLGQLDEANAELRERNAELERISVTDPLTGLFNRRYIMGALERELERAYRHERRVALLMLDVDRFKHYNDTRGHLAGDEVLAAMGSVIRDATRDPDVPGRFGGEEFIVLLPDCDLKGAVDAGERVRTRLAREAFEGGEVTVSIGAAEFPTHGDTSAALIAEADAALYAAKRAGRDRVMAAPAPASPRRSGKPRGVSVRRRTADADGGEPGGKKATGKAAAAAKRSVKKKTGSDDAS